MKKTNLLSKGSTNAKLAKDWEKGVLNYILYLAPYTLNEKGINVCPKASKECIELCLNTAGMGVFSNVQKARIEKTNFLFQDRFGFLSQLWNELEKVDKKAGKSFIKAAVRLNGTSDLDFPKLFTIIGKDIFSLENINFYDYTKVFSRLEKYKNTPYNLTFSRSESNSEDCIRAIELGINVAAVFKNVPLTWNGIEVINGDESDLRFLDKKGEKGVIIGLKAKGKARKGNYNFVIE
jgi:hypothetical protein